MKIVVIGLGSMGKRRIRLLHKIDKTIELIGVDGREDRRNEAEDQASKAGVCLQTYSSIDLVKNAEEVDAAVISTPPLSHRDIIHQCLQNGWNVFTELNLVSDGYDENMELAREKNRVLYLSSTPMFRKEMVYITEQVHQVKKPLNYIYHVGQYLPDWHPWERYQDFFVGQKRTNGCREILAVELPWMIKCFGEVTEIQVLSQRQTSLEIDFRDCYNILISHASGHRGVLVADVVCRPAIRSMEIYGEDFYLTWNGSTDGLRYYDSLQKLLVGVTLYTEVEHREGYSATLIENMYVDELLDFLNVLSGEKAAEYSFEEDLAVLKLIDEIEADGNV